MITTGPVFIEDDANETIEGFVERLLRSQSEEQCVYRESEIDSIYNIVALKAAADAGSDVSAQDGANRDLGLVRRAHDLVHEARIDEAATALKELLRARAGD